MIIGVILRNFKNFKNQHYIPLTLNNKSSWLIGENGVGKSSILQALDIVLNKTDINRLDINNEARSQGFDTREPFIVPIYLINKNKLKINNSLYKALEIVSDITWQIESEGFNTLQRPIAEKFISHRKQLEYKYSSDEYLLIPLGIIKETANDIPRPYMSIFESIDDYRLQIDDLANENSSTNNKKYHFNNILPKLLITIKDIYNYIYLPAEITTSEYSRIESDLLQSLLGENLQQKISKIIKKKDITAINSHLNDFIRQLTTKLEGRYQFKKPSQRQNSFTQRHMISKIIESYFSDKILHHIDDVNKDTPVQNLSSGEKRKALLDLATNFLKHNPQKSQHSTILAVDEPELSLHATSCFNQFDKIKKISDLGIQTICTTHWYGFLPVTGSGTAIYISPSQTYIKALDLENYKDELKELAKESNGSYLDVLEMKSNHDLAQSIVYSITSGNNYNWILCEGKTDRKYISAHLDYENIEKLIVLSVGGSPTVKKIYNLLVMALEDRKATISGKVLLLLDTDHKYSPYDATDTIPSIKIRRLLLNKDLSNISLVKVTDDRVYPPTEIEQSLNADFYVETLKMLYTKGETSLSFMETPQLMESSVSGGALNLNITEKKAIEDYFELPGKKNEFCEKYLEILANSNEIKTPDWLLNVARFFHGDKNVF
ncbi:TPA: AAA family ATPase [Escherichia coli]|uniref:AAA family ATPase n=3 Tax=Escherichia coli TaxID=562 RepID=UPI001659EFCF|nr:AAA family ATPase [Escherichia coli]ELE1010980.1 AAA family ATPase [Escherichia coli]ELP1309213.1 AAA family ATPase [Escherichia coli]ELT5998771.1 AAA family ATPase [Escherichia coli]ELV3655387.1 AAA family ATPase [Escherichia coli]MBC9272721.1 AAA family ATPase [Escherichia coli]